MLPPPSIKRKKVVLKSEMFGYLRIIDRRYYQSSDFLLNFSKVFVLLENPEFRHFLVVFNDTNAYYDILPSSFLTIS